MKILLAGGGSGGHFYPLIAVVRALRRTAEQENIAKIEFFLMSDDPIDADMLLEERIRFIKIPAGKLRRYFSLRHFGDSIKTFAGIFSAFWKLYKLVPDVIFSKGGYASFPTLIAAKILGIPVMIHESDTVPGLVNQWAGNWVNSIAVSFEESLQYFESKNVALVGNPIRPQVVGGNMLEAILSGLAEMVKKYQIIHQTGKNNFADVSGRADILLEKMDLKHRYHVFSFLDEGELRNASKAASIVVSRAAAGAIFEISAWGVPAILIPLPSAAQDHQRENAYAYARFGACEIIEETNLTPHLLMAQIDKILADKERVAKMNKAAQIFSRLDAAEKIGRELLKLGIHE